MENYSEGLATGMALQQGNCYGYGNGFGFGNNSWGELIGLIVVAGLFGFGNFGYGNNGRNGNCATQADVRAAVDQQTLISKLDQQTYGLADSTYALNNTINSNFRTLDNAICTLGYQNQAGVNTLAHQISDCCCTTQRAIDGVNYNMSKGFCDVIRASQDNTNAIIGWLTNEKISTLAAENAGLKAQISNDMQTRTLINEIRPTAVPAYITCNPYQSAYGIGLNNGCSCC